jgi:hypothetical protein
MTDIDICNLALARLGCRFNVASLTEDSAEGRACALIYSVARDAALRRHDWSFATTRLALTDLGTPPDDWSYRYALPADCLKVRQLLLPPGAKPSPFEVAGRELYSNLAEATLIYTKRVTDATLYDPGFIELLILKLAAELAIVLRLDPELLRRYEALAAKWLPEAGAQDANEAAGLGSWDAPWITARGGS